LALACGAGQAQDDQRGLRRDPDSGPQVLREEDAPAPDLELALPPIEAQPDGSALSGSLDRVRCERLLLEGNTVLPDREVRAILDPLQGRDLSADELQGARLALTRLYVERGYVSSGVVLPDQDVSAGTIRLRAVEGRLGSIELRGERPRFAVDAALRPVDALRGEPLNLLRLQRALAAVDADPLVSAVRAELRPSMEPGVATLVLEIVPATPWWAGFQVDNHRAPSVGGEQALVEAGHRSLFGRSDALSVSYAATEGLDDLGVEYTVPVGAAGWNVGVAWSRDDSTVIEEPFDRIDIESGSDRARVSVSRLIGNGIDRFGQFALYLDREASETTLLGVPFSFAPGVIDGKAEVSALRLLGEWGWRNPSDAFVARAILTVGLDAFGSTINQDLPDSRFTALFAQAQFVRLLDDARGDQLVLRAEAQLASEALLPLEKYQLGGAWTVRGYRHNQVVRDNGYAVSAEYRYPLATGRIADWGLTLALFADYGRGWNGDGYAPPPQALDSAGVGLRWDPRPSWHGELYLAAPFTDFDQAEHDLQDSGVHFLIAYRWPAE
jgi:hemolysin activation/secretion protein